MNYQSTTPLNTRHVVVPCKFAMTCARENCTFSHPNPMALITARIEKSVKLCRYDLECKRHDCHFGHSSPALFIQQFINMCNTWEEDFRSFWTTEHPSDEYNTVLNLYLTNYINPNVINMIGHYIQTAIMWREEQQISAEMAECEAVIDSLNQNDEEADNAELMDSREDEILVEEIKNAFASA